MLRELREELEREFLWQRQAHELMAAVEGHITQGNGLAGDAERFECATAIEGLILNIAGGTRDV